MKRLSIVISFFVALAIFVFPHTSHALPTDEQVEESTLDSAAPSSTPAFSDIFSHQFSPSSIGSNSLQLAHSAPLPVMQSSKANDPLFQERTISSQGTSGTCIWVLYSDGEMVVSPAEGAEGTLGGWTATSGMSWSGARGSINTVRFEGTISAQSCYRLFYNWSNLTSIDFTNFNTPNVTDMSEMFLYCEKLDTIDMSSLDTSQVTNMASVFHGCRALRSINFSNFNTSKVTSMFRMFYSCLALQSLDLKTFDTSKVTNMKQMFGFCTSLESLDISTFNTESVTDMDGMFSSCRSLTSFDLSHFNTSKLTSMSNLFSGCSGLTYLNISNFDVGNITTMDNMFYHCSSLEYIDITSFYTHELKETTMMFGGCTQLKRIYAGAGYLRFYITSSSNMFLDCINLVGLYGTHFSEGAIDDLYGRLDRIDRPGYFTQPQSLSGVELTVNETEFTYNEEIQRPEITKTGDYHLFPEMEYDVVVLEGDPINAGTYKLVIDGKGLFSGRSAEVEFYIHKAQPQYTIPENLHGYVGLPLGTAPLPDGWSWDNPSTILSDTPGTYNFTATYTPSDTHNYETVSGISLPLKVLPKIDINNATITLDPEICTYNTLPQTPQITAVYGEGESAQTLVENEDYTLTFINNINVGTATVTIAGKGKCINSVNKSFTIQKATPHYTIPQGLTGLIYARLSTISLPEGWSWENPETLLSDVIGAHDYSATFTPLDTHNYDIVSGISVPVESLPADINDTAITLDPETFVYDTSAHQPQVTVRYGEGESAHTLVENTDYTLLYEHNIDAGQAQVTVTGMGRYTSSITRYFTITKAIPEYSIPEGLFAYENMVLSTINLPAGWSWNNPNERLINPGQPHSYLATFTPEDTHNYQIVDNISVPVNVLPLIDINDAAITLEPASFVYDGKEKKPQVTVVYREGATEHRLIENVDYALRYEKNINAGTARVIIAGRGKYTATATKTFIINKANPTYTIPSGLCGSYMSTLKNVKLPTGWSWKQAQTKLTKLGLQKYKARFVPKDQENYKIVENLDVPVQIGVPISAAKVSLAKSTFIYKGTAIKPKIASIEVLGINLKKNVDYKVSYRGANQPGNASVDIIGIGNFTGKISIPYKITLAQASVKSEFGTASQKKLTFEWKAVAGAQYYEIEYRIGKGKAKRVVTKKLSHIFKVNAYETCECRVRAVRGKIKAPWSEIEYRWNARVKKAKAKKLGSKSLMIYWTAEPKARAGYSFVFSYDGLSHSPQVKYIEPGKTSFILKNVKKGARVTLAIRPLAIQKGEVYFGERKLIIKKM